MNTFKAVSYTHLDVYKRQLGKGFIESMRELEPDFICIQETKMQEGQAEVDLPEYEEFFCSAEKKGYSGTAIFAKEKPLAIQKNFGDHQDAVSYTHLLKTWELNLRKSGSESIKL